MMAARRVMMNGFWYLLSDREGTTHAEYALILAIIGTAIAFGALWLAGLISPSINEAGTCISTNGMSCHG